MPDALTAGAEFAGFRIVREIGRGGMGLVYLAEQPSLGRFVALKVITPALAGDELFRQRFEREAHHAASIEHPNVIPIFEAGTSGEHLYLAMRFVEGVDLGSYLRESGPLEPRVAASVVEQIGAALDAAHAKALDPSRREAGEHPDRRRRSRRPRLPHRFRPDQGARRRFRAHGHRGLGRDRRLRGPGADPGRHGRRPHRRLRAQLRALRVAHRRDPLPGHGAAEDVGPHEQPAAGGAAGAGRCRARASTT